MKTDKQKAVDTTIFIAEVNSVSAAILKTSDIGTQALFLLKGKPLNVYGLNKRAISYNEQFNALEAVLNIENGVENLRYDKIVMLTDKGVDGAHIQLLLLTYFLQFFPEIIYRGYLYIGEISHNESMESMYSDLKLKQIPISKNDNIEDILRLYMGANSISRQELICSNQRADDDTLSGLFHNLFLDYSRPLLLRVIPNIDDGLDIGTTILPVKFPLLLLQGAVGIAPGYQSCPK